MFLNVRPFDLRNYGGLTRHMDRIFADLLEPVTARPAVYPALNVWEDSDTLYAEAEVPGLKMEDLEILVVGDELTLKGTHRTAAAEGAVFHRQERATGEFTRFLTLPVAIDADRVQAALNNGVLTITMPKAPEAKARKITVKAG